MRAVVEEDGRLVGTGYDRVGYGYDRFARDMIGTATVMIGSRGI